MLGFSEDSVPNLILSVLCYVYERLLEFLPAFDEAFSAHTDSESDAYSLLIHCLNQSAAKFGRSVPKTREHKLLREDMLRRFKGTLDLELSSDSPAFLVFDNYRDVVLQSPQSAPIELVYYQKIGEALSRDCYCQTCSSDMPNLSRQAELVIQPRNQWQLTSHPRKQSGISTISFDFATDQFDFGTFVNLPFYFFHEYFSHIHSAEMYAERVGTRAPFEDGWLLYAAHEFYRQQLLNPKLASDLSHPECRRTYVDNYIYHSTDLVAPVRSVRFGYRLSQKFAEITSTDLFWQTTIKLALVRYNALPDYRDLHFEFMNRMKDWLRRITDLSTSSRDEFVDLLRLACQADNYPEEILDALAL